MAEQLRIVDSRRMTGSNLYTRESGVIVDVAFEDSPLASRVDDFVAAWRAAIARVWPFAHETFTRAYRGGIALFVTGPLDALMPLTDLNDWAVLAAEAALLDRAEPELDPRILDDVRRDHVPGLAELIAAARTHDQPLLVDDDAITVGTGTTQLRFRRRGPVPAPAEIEWSALAPRIPIGIVTGTNGKTTTTRLAARMARLAGLVPGITSSDGVAVNEQFVQRGDFSGPEGTRLALRDARVQIAILETARGGILRRGLTVERCDAALITNVSGDHLGDYGVDDVATMARVKAVVGRDARTVVLNAMDPSLVALAPQFGDRVAWFARDRTALGDRDGWTIVDGQVAHVGRASVDSAANLDAARVGHASAAVPGREVRMLVAIADIPLTFGGRAAYNIDNALAASALAHALGIPDRAIADGLRSFTSSADDNPGRGNVYETPRGVRVLLDFGHNPAAIRSVLSLARAFLAEPAREHGGVGALRVTIGMPGDRLDNELREIANEIAAGSPAHVVVRELSHDLLRGRAVGDVPAVLSRALVDANVPRVELADNEVDAVTRLLDAARPGDLVLVLTHIDPAVLDLL